MLLPAEGEKEMRRRLPIAAGTVVGFLILLSAHPSIRGQETSAIRALTVFNVKDFGATGSKTDKARESIQRAVDACDEAGGGTVCLTPGEYTSGTIHLRDPGGFFIETVDTLF